jgi:uncharacterized membrane protein YeaQ/YmgE (transglycosylase-associated protein family)
MLNYIWMFVVGIAAGGLARFLLPGADSMGIMMTGLLGIVGSFIGGGISRIFSKPADGAAFNRAGFIMSVIGAVIALIAWRYLR